MKMRIIKLSGLLLLFPLVFALGSCAGGSGGGCSPIMPVPGGCAKLQDFVMPGGTPVGLHVLLPKFECAQAPTEDNCCISNNPLVAWNANACCTAYNQILSDRLASGMTRDQAAATPYTPEEAAAYAAACTSGGPPVLVMRCRCDNPEDRIESCSTEDRDCCFPVSRDRRPTPFTCQLELAEGTITTEGLTTNDILSQIQSQTATWNQVAGTQLVGVDGAPPPGTTISGASLIKTSTKAIESEPLDTTFHGLAPIPYGGKGTQADERYEFALLLTSLNGSNQGEFSDDIAFALHSEGGCGGCGLWGPLEPKNIAVNLLFVSLLIAIPFFFRRRLVRVRIRRK